MSTGKTRVPDFAKNFRFTTVAILHLKIMKNQIDTVVNLKLLRFFLSLPVWTTGPRYNVMNAHSIPQSLPFNIIKA